MPRDGTATRERILDAAERLVIEHGYAGTSVDKVIAESGSSKGAFFHHFDSKLDLARSLIERYAAADVTHLQDALEATAEIADPAARLVEFLRMFEEGADELIAVQSSCLYVAVLTERQLAFGGTVEQIDRAVRAWRDEIAALLRAALGGRTAAVDPEAWADHLFTTFEGAFILCRATGDSAHMRRQLGVVRQQFQALLGLEIEPV